MINKNSLGLFGESDQTKKNKGTGEAGRGKLLLARLLRSVAQSTEKVIDLNKQTACTVNPL